MEASKTRTRYSRQGGLLAAAALSALMPLAFLHCSGDEKEDDKKTSTPTTTAGGNIEQARQFFLTQVYPTVDKQCGKCHSSADRGAPVWLAKNGEGSYNAIEAIPGYLAAPTVSPIMQKGLHSGPAFTEAEQEAVRKWLALEVSARKLSGDTDRPANLREAFKRFGECMSYKRWMELEIDKVGLTPTIGATGQCVSCHASGQSSLWLSEDPAETFLKFTQFPYVQKLVVGRVNNSGAFDGLEGSRRLINKGTEAQQFQANAHPRYSLTAQQAENITVYVNETISNMNAKRCENADRPDAGPDTGTEN